MTIESLPPATEPVASTSAPEATILVELYGTSVTLPISIAKTIIASRDAKTAEYKQLKSSFDEKEKVARDATAKSELLEKMKSESYENIKNEFQKESVEKLGKLHNAFIQNQLKATLASNDEFIGGQAIDDAVKLITSSHAFTFDGDSLVAKSVDGKELKEVVAEFVKSKDIFRKAIVKQGTGIVTKSAKATIARSSGERLGAGIADMLAGKYK
jgi:hypothetical protein